MVFLIIFLLLSVFESRIIQVQWVTHSCDRTPEWNYITKLNKFSEKGEISKLMNLTYGQLTPLGQQQCYLLGKNITKRYINTSDPSMKIFGINPRYNSIDYYFTSDSFDRTIISGVSISLGLFPNFEGLKVDVSPWANQFPYKYGEQAVPYFVYENDDSILSGSENCPVVVSNRAPNEKDFTTFFKEIKSTVNELESQTGNSIDNLWDFYYMYDYLRAMASHDLLPSPSLQKLWDTQVSQLGRETYSIFYNTKTLGENLGGGPFLETFLENLDDRKNNEKYSYKFIHYSGHDTTLTSIFAALSILEPHDFLRKQPSFGSSLLFELHQNDLDYNQYFVRMYYIDGWNGELRQLSLGDCSPDCDYETFHKAVEEGVPEDWCLTCKNVKSNRCLEEKTKNLDTQVESAKKSRDQLFVITIVLGLFIIFLIFIVVVVLFLYVCERTNLEWIKRKKKRYEPI